MIKQETILTATPIALERVPQSFRLYDKVNPLIQGLSSTALSIEGYSLDDIAVKLPKNTEGDSEHTQLINASIDRISPIIRQSLSVISQYVIPTCDILENALKNCDNRNRLIDKIFRSFHVYPKVLDRNLLSSIAFDLEPDNGLLNGVLFTPVADLEHDKIDVPNLKANAIRELVKESLTYSELAEVFNNDDDVEEAFLTLFKNKYWLYNGQNKDIDVRTIDIDVSKLNKLIILNVLLYKLDAQETPLEDLTGISLEQYRRHIATLKRFVKTLMVMTKRKLQGFLDQGITIFKSDVKFEVMDNEYSPFKKTKVLRGDVGVFISKEMADYFNASEQYNVTEIILGLELINKGFGTSSKASNIIDRFPDLIQTVHQYYTVLGSAMNTNIRIEAGNVIRETIVELAKGPIWKEYLDSLEGNNNTNKLEKMLAGDTGYNELLTSPHFISKICEGTVRVANTIIAPRLANGLGAPIAAEILTNNLTEECGCEEKQRKLLASSIAKVVIEKLMV